MVQTFDKRQLKPSPAQTFAPKSPHLEIPMAGAQTITFNGDASGSGSTAITVKVVGIQGYAVPVPGATAGNLRWTGAAWTLDTVTYLVGINSGMVTTALGFTPLNATAQAADSAKLGGAPAANYPQETDSTWTPTISGISGSPTVIQNYTKKVGNLTFWQLRITGTSMAATGGTAKISLPSALAHAGTGEAVSGGNTSLGIGYANPGDNNFYPPTFSGQSDITLSGFYFTT